MHTKSILHNPYFLRLKFSFIEQYILFIYTMIGLCILFAETINDPSSIIRKVHWNFTWLYMILSEWQSAKKHIFSNWFVSTWRNLWYADNNVRNSWKQIRNVCPIFCTILLLIDFMSVYKFRFSKSWKSI